MSTIERFYEVVGSDELSPLERLRAFCSLSMSGQDWIDVEPFFVVLEEQIQDLEKLAGVK